VTGAFSRPLLWSAAELPITHMSSWHTQGQIYLYLHKAEHCSISFNLLKSNTEILIYDCVIVPVTIQNLNTVIILFIKLTF
jgi:hypothetical protein